MKHGLSFSRSVVLSSLKYFYWRMRGKITAPAAERNKEPILQVLKEYIPSLSEPHRKLFCLEIASGTGQHIAHFAREFQNVIWQPSEIEEADFMSIRAHVAEGKLTNVLPPVKIDIRIPFSVWGLNGKGEQFKPSSIDMIYNANMMHISEIACSHGLFVAAGGLLRPGGLLITYGPYANNGVLEPQSNRDFDSSLRRRDSSWGVRDIVLLKEYASKNGISLERIIDMPANNKMLIWKK
ncbi:methyltransferase-like 26 [Ischnura elegans]|uniref:methyltransferase-like 26 n=1 Tax=Ischnura elegans TaxID=197161 RepID=UPI001ED87239|nr:methyltransferase-like 26 [Ischnura elegans]